MTFIHRGGEQMASYRYRAKIPAEQIGANINEGEAELVIFSKPTWEDLILARDLKDKGAGIIVDFCDDHFGHPELGKLYKDFKQLADVCVCPTKIMAYKIPGAHVIPDPYEMPELEPHADGKLKLWFGHNSNLKDIWNFRNLENLRIISGPKVGDGITHWSKENIDRAMRESSIVLFPTSEGSEYKSPNRFVNAVRMGLFPVCSPHPAYEEFKNHAWVNDIKTGLKWAEHFKSDLNDLVHLLQMRVREKYSPEAVGKKWKDLLESI